jgi:hypothetical protein
VSERRMVVGAKGRAIIDHYVGKTRELLTNANIEFSRLAFMGASLDRRGRDLNRECGYFIGDPPFEYYWELYDREGIATRVNDLYPDETWAVNPEMVENPDPKTTTKFERAFGKLVDNPETNPWLYGHRVDVLSGIGRYGAILYGFNDGTDESKPLPGLHSVTGEPTSKSGTPKALKLWYMRAFSENMLKVAEIDTNIQSPRYRRPTMYTLATYNSVEDPTYTRGSNDGEGIKIHWTRVEHMADNLKNGVIYGTPRMKPVLNRLLDVRKILGASAEMFYKGGWPGHSIEAMPGVTEDLELDAESIKDEMERYYNNIKRYIALVGATVKPLAPNIVDPEKHIEQQLRAIAASLGCPLRVFLGSEAAHLASTQDIQTWNKRIARRQKMYVNPLVIYPIVKRFQSVGVLPMVEKYTVNWKDLNALSDKDKADVSLKKAQALLQYVSSGSEKAVSLLHFLTVFMEIPDDLAQSMVAAAMSNKTYLTKELWKPAGDQPPGSGKKSSAKKTSSGSTRNGVGKAK